MGFLQYTIGQKNVILKIYILKVILPKLVDLLVGSKVELNSVIKKALHQCFGDERSLECL